MLSSVLLLLLISGAQASYYGVVSTYYTRDFQSGRYPETNEFRLSFSSCEEYDTLFCGGDCSGHPVYLIDESRGEWCQKVHVWTGYSFLSTYSTGGVVKNWTENRNGIGSSAYEFHVESRNRSDINKPNSPPQTASIPLVRVPSNCQRNINLLVSDPDGDDIRCRYAAGSECNICTPPSVLNVSSSCSLSFSPTNSSNEGPYAVQMVVEDFPRQNVTLTDRNGGQEVKTPSNTLNRIPIQFVFRVDPAAPSCTEGEFLPRFLPPTPEHGAQIYTNDSETLEIIIRAEATQAVITELLISGPVGVTKSSSGSGNFTLTWRPLASDRELKKTLCFVVQANSSGSVYQSDLRCVFVTAGAQGSYYGIFYTYYIGDFQSGGYPETGEFRLSFSSCEEYDTLFCGGNCSGIPVYLIDESRGEWCQKVYIQSSSTSLVTYSDGWFATNWIENRNGIVLSGFEWHFDSRNRSDINKPNSSPQTAIIPLVRVPSNCQRNINLLVSDPDGDDIRCRYAAGSECNICTPPSVLNVSSSCSLSFSPTNSSNEGPYAVQMTVKDFPRQNVTLTDYSGVQEVKTPSDFFSSIPIQFVFRVDPAAPSCTEGEFLPRFLPPTPEHGAQISTNFKQAVEIIIRAEATQAVITELLISGPVGVTKSSSGSGNFTLTWRPLDSDRGLKKTLCFVVQANSSGSVYQSDLRCVFVTAGGTPTTVSPLITTATPFTPNMITTPLFATTPPPTSTTTANQPTTTTTTPPASSIQNSTPVPGPYYVLALDAMISTTLSMKNDSATIMNLIKEELKRQGLPSDITLKLLSSREVGVTTPAP